MMTEQTGVILETNLPLTLAGRGKVRETYDLGETLLIVTTDRVSTFDVIHPNGIPDKGKVLNQISAFWFEKTRHLMPNHVIAMVDDLAVLDKYVPAAQHFDYPDYLVGRSMIVKKADVVMVECVVRGYLAGSGWEDYQRTGQLFEYPLAAGLAESEILPEPLFTPTTKANEGHDMPMTLAEMAAEIGDEVTATLKNKTLEIYSFARDYARQRGIIIADTKFEFGYSGGELIIIDEMLSPDSSRFWDMATYQAGRSQPSYDKQPIRDWATASGWDKTPPGPMLPEAVIEESAARYRAAYELITGRSIV
jgi:phosphoribosylaminoimidazole-succinocarboxamide synthase